MPDDQDAANTEPKVDLRNQHCKEPFLDDFYECMADFNDPAECQIPFNAGNLDCDERYKSSLS